MSPLRVALLLSPFTLIAPVCAAPLDCEALKSGTTPFEITYVGTDGPRLNNAIQYYRNQSDRFTSWSFSFTVDGNGSRKIANPYKSAGHRYFPMLIDIFKADNLKAPTNSQRITYSGADLNNWDPEAAARHISEAHEPLKLRSRSEDTHGTVVEATRDVTLSLPKTMPLGACSFKVVEYHAEQKFISGPSMSSGLILDALLFPELGVAVPIRQELHIPNRNEPLIHNYMVEGITAEFTPIDH